LVLVLGMFPCCSRQGARDEVKSDLRSASSFASEAEMFIEQVQQKRVTEDYALGHLDYLADEIKTLADDLPHGTDANSAPQLETCRVQIEALRKALSKVRADVRNAAALVESKNEIERIRGELQRAHSSL